MIQEREKSLQFLEISQTLENLIKTLKENPIHELITNLFKEEKLDKIENIENIQNNEDNEFQEKKEVCAIPEGYAKSIEQKLEWENKLPGSLNIPQGFQIAYEIINEILDSKFQ